MGETRFPWKKSLKYGVRLLTPQHTLIQKRQNNNNINININNASNTQTQWLLMCLLTHSPAINLNMNWVLSLAVWLVRLFGLPFVSFGIVVANKQQLHTETILFTFLHKSVRV